MPPFDMGLVQRGARNRRTPYYEATQRSSPKAFTVYNHMYFPVRFDTFENEFQALLNDVTIWDVSVERCIEVSGPDGFQFALGRLLLPEAGVDARRAGASVLLHRPAALAERTQDAGRAASAPLLQEQGCAGERERAV